jgi:hypothetical protein
MEACMIEFIVPMFDVDPGLDFRWTEHEEMQIWCNKMFGVQASGAGELSENQRWGNRWHEGNMWWFFYRAEDASHFALRWL